MIGALAGLVDRLFLRQWKAIDAEWRETSPRSYDWRPLMVLVCVAVSLTFQDYWGQTEDYHQLYPERLREEYGLLEGYAWWSGWRFAGYVLLPVLAILAMPGERLRDYFISLRSFPKHLWIYVGLYLLVLPAVIIASQTTSFRETYPFYAYASRSALDLWVWEALYALQFLSLEFFFRGFMLKALAPKFGSGAIFVMIVPYCMIHFDKPMLETLGAIIAGIVLGTLALRTRSIWGGVVVHVGVALTMDLLALSG